MDQPWWDEAVPVATTALDVGGTTAGIGARAREAVAADGVGALDCRPEPARTRLAAPLREQRAQMEPIQHESVTTDRYAPIAPFVPLSAVRTGGGNPRVSSHVTG